MGLNINIISNKNGVGLEKDLLILTQVLEENGATVFHIPSMTAKMQPRKTFAEAKDVDINIFLEHYLGVDFLKSKARLNILIPNAEWFFDRSYVKKFDIILCKTKDCYNIFKGLGGQVLFSSFTSIDMGVTKKEEQWCHCSGKSSFKNTESVFQAWQSYEDLPHLFLLRQQNSFTNLKNLTFVSDRLSDEHFKRFITVCRYHLCPSQYEGFGHYIWEAFSSGSIVITSNHQPMNEFVSDRRLLVDGKPQMRQGYAMLFKANHNSIKNVVQRVMNMSEAEKNLIQKRNRETWEQNDLFFKDIMKKICGIKLT
jgi:glycosyltransferase involved in cell wall biosynthesis